MVRYKDLGFESFDAYKNYFFSTLLKSNKTYEYFVNWRKIKEKLRGYLKEIFLLNSLAKVEENKREIHMRELILAHPRILEVIPLLIAERIQEGKISVFDDEVFSVVEFIFESKAIPTEEEVKNIIRFCKKTGIIDLFNEVKDLYDYLLGVEVGLDSNARKNRSGKIFEKVCVKEIKKLLGNRFKVVEQDSKLSKGRKHDLVIYIREPERPLLIVECNFYNTEGSKPQSVAREYIKLKSQAEEKHVQFLWITDGPAWIGMRNVIEESMRELDWVLNLRMLGLIDRVLKVIV